MNIEIETLSATPTERDLADLDLVLCDAVESGASIGFMLPIDKIEIRNFWRDVFSDVGAGKRVMIAARASERIVGTVQLALATKANARHRAELQKLLVLRSCRGRGIGCALMNEAETAARAHHRTLLVLDTSATGNALGVYGRAGYTRVGAIPRYARDPEGPLIDTIFYYKELALADGPSASAAAQTSSIPSHTA
jgi:ribosomal protein S18 acetylase RimI-like enzyme